MKYLTIAIVVAVCASGSTSQAQGSLDGRWEGGWTRSGATLEVSFDFRRTDAGYAGEFGSTQLRATGIPLSKISQAGQRVHFELVGDRTTAIFDGELRGDTLSGSIVDGDARGTFSARRAAASTGPAYREEQVTFANGGTTLAGSLLMPNAGRPRYPAIVFLHGSGPEGRFGSRFMADLFARRGIATFIYDKRGVGASKGDWRTSDYNALAQDAIAAIAMLRSRSDIDSLRIGIYGHSQGASIAPLIASRAPVAFVVASAASGIRADEGERFSLRNSLRGGTLTPAESGRAMRFVDAVIQSGREGARTTVLDSIVLRDSAERWLFAVPSGEHYYWAFSRAIANYDPSQHWARVRVPVLLLYGELDQRVAVTESRARIEAALRRANNTRYTVRVFPDADHTMRLGPAPGGAFQWPRNPPGYLDFLVNWVVREAGAQDADKAAVVAAVQRLFDALETRDSVAGMATFHPSATILVVAGTPTTVTQVTPAALIGGIVRSTAGTFKERIFDTEVRIDGDVAQLWAYFTVHIGKAFDRCGTDAMTLVRVDGAWKISHASFTRRTQDCKHSEPLP